MGWILSIAFLIVAALTGGISGNAALIASALFAIAGSIGLGASVLKPKEQKQDK